MGNEIELRNQAQLLAGSRVARANGDNAADVYLKIGLGAAMGISPAEALTRIHVIDGKPTASAELTNAMVRRAGHYMTLQGTAERAVCRIKRRGDNFVYETILTRQQAAESGIDKAKNGGIKDNWKKYPAAMLKARVVTECARAACPDALFGIVYTPEELGSEEMIVEDLSASEIIAEPLSPDELLAQMAVELDVNKARELWLRARDAGASQVDLDAAAQMMQESSPNE